MWGIIVSIFIGALAGFIAGKIMKSSHGLLLNIIIGLVGGVLGSWIFSQLELTVSDTFWGQLLVGTAGAVVLLFILSLFKKK